MQKPNLSQIQNFIILFFTVIPLVFIPGMLYAQNTGLNEITDSGLKQNHIDLSKMSSSNLIISNGTSFVGSFSTTYTISGTASDIKDSIDVIVSSILDDFTNTPTIGYVKLSNSESNTSNTQQIANPFASNEQIEQKIQELMDKSIADVTNLKSDMVSITCYFGNNLDLFSCSMNSLLD